MEQECIFPDSLRTRSDDTSAKLELKPRSEDTLRLIKKAVVFLVVVLCFIFYLKLGSLTGSLSGSLTDSLGGSLTRFLDIEMVKWKWPMASLPAVKSGVHVLDLSTADWTVSNGENVTVPGSLPSVVCLTPTSSRV